MFFVGIDLAWSKKNWSGLTIIEFKDNKLNILFSDILLTDDDIIDKILQFVGFDKSCIIGIDAPVIVNNDFGMRKCDSLLNADFRKFNAGVHPCNRKILSRYNGGEVRSIVLCEKLSKFGFIKDFLVNNKESKRTYYEIYPHSASIVLFGLKRVLQYKARKNRSLEFRQKELLKLKMLIENTFFLSLDVLNLGDFNNLKGKEFKKSEDILDSVFCSLIVFSYWSNINSFKIYGDINEGYVLTPKL